MKGRKKHLGMTVVLAVVLAAIALLATTQVARADGPIYVDRDAPGPTHDGLSWATAYTNLQDGLDAAAPGDEIWVAEGVYMPTHQTEAGDGRTATFVLTNSVGLYGGFGGYGINETLRSERDWAAHVTVLSGDLDGNDITDPNGVVTDTDNINGDNAYHVVTDSGTDGTAVLDGFTITGGQANGSMPHGWGGGMYSFNNSNPTLSNITFSSNRASARGGGMYNSDGNPTLTNVTFSGNRASASGGGMSNGTGGSPTLINVTFSGNIAHTGSGGGMYNDHCNPTLINVTFSGNHASFHGGGMYSVSSNPALINATFSGNHASSDGGGMYSFHNSNPTLSNCILWGNAASNGPQIYSHLNSTPTVKYSLVEGGYSGIGNLDVDPQFVDFDGTDNITGTLDDNLRLLPASPAIDAGDNTAVPTDTLDLDGDGVITEPLPFDLDGNPRLADMPSRPDTGNGAPPIVDMGAYEAAPGLAVLKSVDIGGLTNVPLGGVVTYTLVIRNSGDGVVSSAVVTDPMPVGLTFGQWIDRGSAQLLPPVTWGPWDVGARTAYTLSFTAHVTKNIGFAGRTIINTAHFTAANQAPGTSNPAAFIINRSPVADAGADRTVIVSTTVTLDGGGSTDADSDELTYLWTQTGGTPPVLLSSSVISRPTFTAPGAPTVLTFTLTVTDTGGLADADTVVITVTECTIYLPLVMRNSP
jgi:uncharacterized repeat protein (TIGR01451 family)